MIFRFKNKGDKGFTLVEVLVSISIVVILTAVLVPRYRMLQKRSILIQDAHRLSESIREAQEMSVSGRRVEGVFPDGYGVYLRERDSEYIIFADMNDDGEFNNPVVDSVIERRDLNSSVEVRSLPRATPLHVVFIPPEPETEIRNGPLFEELFIALGVKDTSYEKSVYINKAGLTYVE